LGHSTESNDGGALVEKEMGHKVCDQRFCTWQEYEEMVVLDG